MAKQNNQREREKLEMKMPETNKRLRTKAAETSTVEIQRIQDLFVKFT
jgi:hypothetical protein